MPTLLLLRHGRTTANSAGLLAGRAPGVGLDDYGSAQAAALPAPTTGEDAQRLADLQARAEALRDGVLTDEERARLESGASLP